MAKKKSPRSNSSGLSKEDDLKRIDGIGPTVEKRLQKIGIVTFARLSTLSPADIAAAVAGISGLSAERIIKQDWIGQAQKLALQSTSQSNLAEEADVPKPIVTEEHNNRQIKLVDSSTAVFVENEPRITVSRKNSSSNLINISKPQMVLSDTHILEHMLRVDQHYEVQFTINLADSNISPTSSLDFTASAYGMAVDQWIRYPMGKMQGNMRPTEEFIVSIRGESLPPDTYWLEVEVLAFLPTTTEQSSPDKELLVTVKGHLFEIS